MKIREPTTNEKAALRKYNEAGCKIHHAFFECEAFERSNEGISYHREAAKLTMQGLEPHCTQPFVHDYSKLVGSKITSRQFFGNWYDFERRKLRSDLNPGVRQGTTGFVDGYAMLFVHSAVRLKRPRLPNRERLFEEIVLTFFGDIEELQDIYSWNTSFCSYFEDAPEWWGGFLWTVAKGNDVVIGIAAGSLD